MTIREAINANKYFHVAIPAWASGGMDVIADCAAEAALWAGCLLESFGGRNRPDATEVSAHLRGSSIGCAYLESVGQFQTLTADHYSI